MEQKEKFPQYLHRPYRLLWFEMDEIVLAIGIYALAMLFTMYFVLFLPLGVYLFRLSKNKRPRGFYKHIWYRLGLYSFKGYPHAFERDFRE